jgi:TRAP-type transport system periplasmic protein
MWAAVERETGGRIHTQFFPNNQLGGDAASFAQLRLGALDFFFINPGNVAAVVPAADISYLGFAYKNADEALRVMDGPLGAYVRAEIATKGMYAFRAMWDSGMIQVGSNSHPIRTPDDLHGYKIRVVESRIAADLFKGLGASPTPINYADVYTALQTRIIDGEAAPLVAIETARFFEVQKYVSLTNHAWSGNWLLANSDTWKKIPPDLAQIVERNNTKYARLERRDTNLVNGSLADKLSRQGIVLNQVDQAPFRARLRSYFELWASAFGTTEWGLLESSLGRRLS